MSKEDALDLSRIVFIGRTFEEYMAMFNLSNEDLTGRTILDCPAGACSFTAVVNRLGADVTAADIVYCHDYEELRKKGEEDIEHAMTKMECAQTNYVWDYFKSVDGLRKHRFQALTDCSNDMKLHPHRYVPATLPVLPFGDNQFDLTLSAHFLFMYEDRLDYEFHEKTIQELIRVTRKEIRIYPLINLSSKKYALLDKLQSWLNRVGYLTEEIPVDYEFQKGANSMLKITVNR